MPADKRLIECPSCYATKGQYHKPGCPALTPPADPAAVPPPAWAVEMAKTVGDCGSHHDSDGACCVEIVNRLARLLASVREGALREASGVCGKRAAEFNRLNVEGGMGKAKSYQHGREADACGGAILALLHTPPSGGGGA